MTHAALHPQPGQHIAPCGDGVLIMQVHAGTYI